MHLLHQEAWDLCKKGGKPAYGVPDFSVLTYREMDSLQHWDMPPLPYYAHHALMTEMGKRIEVAVPCVTCGHRDPE